MVAALCVHWLDRPAFIQRLSPELTFSSQQMKSLVEHIHQFTLGGASNFVRQTRLRQACKVGTNGRGRSTAAEGSKNDAVRGIVVTIRSRWTPV